MTVVAALVLLQVPSTAGAERWRGPRELAAETFIRPAEIDTARDGSTATVWIQPGADGENRLYYRRITPAGRLKPRITLSKPYPRPAVYDVAVDDDGDAVVVWQAYVYEPTDVQWQVFARRVSKRGHLGPVVRISDRDETSDVPRVAVAPRGVATVVYTRGVPTAPDNTVVRRLWRDSSRGRPAYLPRGYVGSPPAVSRSGHVAFVVAPTDEGQPELLVRVDPDGDVRKRELRRGVRGGVSLAEVDVDRHGNAYAVLQRADANRAWVRRWPVGAKPLGKARRVTPRGQQPAWVEVRTDLAGDAVVLWAEHRANQPSFTLRARTWRGERLGRVADLGRMDGPEIHGGIELSSWSLDLDDDGDGVLAWEVYRERIVDTIVRTRAVGRDGRFGRARDLGQGGSPAVAVAPRGQARLSLWSDKQDDTQLLLWTRR